MKTAPERTLKMLYQDITLAAAICEVAPINEDKFVPVLRAYSPFFTQLGVGMRTTDHPVDKRELDVRDLDYTRPNDDPYPLAVKQRFIVTEGHPIEDVVPELQAKYAFAGYGIDVGVRHGFKKVWALPQAGIPIEELYRLRCLPDSVRLNRDYHEKYGFHTVSLLAFDYRNRTVNFYFVASDRSKFTPEMIGTQISDLGFKMPPADELLLNSQTVCIYLTYSWDSPRIERLCHVLGGLVGVTPLNFSPLLRRFAEQAPVITDQRKVMYSNTYSAKGDYWKLELDYTGNIGAAAGYAISVV